MLRAFFLLLIPSLVLAAVHSTDGSLEDVQRKVRRARDGDVVTLPAGRFVWGTRGATLEVAKRVTVQGAGIDRTYILPTREGKGGTAGLIRITRGGAIGDFTVEGAPKGTLFQATGEHGFRVYRVKYLPNAKAYFCYATVYGLIDGCDITGFSGSNELIFVRGKADSWKKPSSLGTVDALYIEDCTFRGAGYVSDFNSNSRGVVRFCTIGDKDHPGDPAYKGWMKIDAHGLASNTPPRGVRHMEVYGNTWWGKGGFWMAIEMRGGSGVVFDNEAKFQGGGRVKTPLFKLRDYLYFSSRYKRHGGGYKTLLDYPVQDQIGRGRDASDRSIMPQAAEPYYVWNNRRAGADWPLAKDPLERVGLTGMTDGAGYPAGATVITLTQCEAFGSNGNVGDYCSFEGDPHRYRIAAKRGAGPGAVMLEPPGLVQPLPPAAAKFRCGPIEKYQALTGKPDATYSFDDVIKPGRDYFRGAAGGEFDKATGVGRGTKAEMLKASPERPGVGFWVTDEGDWNRRLSPGTSGQLYVWSGAEWRPAYTPLTYPHPARRGG